MGFIGIVFIVCIILLLLRKFMNSPGSGAHPATGRNNVTVDDVLKYAYPNCSYVEIYRRTMLAAMQLLDSMPCKYMQFDLYAFLYQIGDITVRHVKGNITEYENSIRRYLSTVYSDDMMKRFEQRVDFYYKYAYNSTPHGLWSAKLIPESILSIPMLRAAVAFGDVITAPSMLVNYRYDSSLYKNRPELREFEVRFTTDFYALVHTYCIQLAGYDFDPPEYHERGQ